MSDRPGAAVTGASSGIGRALVLDLARSGHGLHLLGRDEGALAEVAGMARNTGAPWATCVPCDLRDDGSVKASADRIAQAGPLDLLVHSAGVVTLGRLADAPISDLDLNWAVNVRAPVLLTRLLLPAVTDAQGQVVFINSGAGLAARAGWGHYASGKHALRAIADALREEVRPDGVRVLTCYPGRTATPMQRRVRQLEGAPYVADDYLRPEDVARVVCEALALPRGADVTELKVRPGPG